MFQPLGPLSHADGVAVFAEQMAAVVEAGADVLWIETLSSWEELEAAVEAASNFDLPAVATLSFDTNGHTMMGLSPTELGSWWATRGGRPLAVGANCGVGPGDAVAAVFDIGAIAPEAITVAKANCGMPLFETDRLVYPVSPEGMGDYVELAIRSGARIIGACCGSSPAHVAAIRAAVDAGVSGGRPDRSEIEARLEARPQPPVVPRRARRRG